MPSNKKIIGHKFNQLTVVKDSGKRTSSGNILWTCQCDCGNFIDVPAYRLKREDTKSCGCYRKKLASTNYLPGQRFGRLTILEDTNKISSNNRKIYKCKCDCGNIIEITSHQLTSNKVPSCGCYLKEIHIEIGKNSKKNLLNQTFGKLTVIRETEERDDKGSIIWECKCECGKITKVSTHNLTGLHILSCGCTNQSHGELKIEQILKENNIDFISEYIDKKCKLSTNGYGRFDFYINNQYYLEFDGSQHYFASGRNWNTTEHLIKTQLRDKEKNQYCIQNNIPLIRIPYTHLKNLCLEDLLLETSNFIYKRDKVNGN